MYNSHNIANRIRDKAKVLNKPLKTVLAESELSINSISNLSNGGLMSYLSLAKIADSLDCSVDYLLGRKVSGETLNRKEIRLIDLYQDLSEDDQILLLAQALQMKREKEKSS